MNTPLLDVRGLMVELPGPEGNVRVVDGLDFTLAGGETLALVGESGCGKSQTALAIIGLSPPKAVVTGSVRFEDGELLGASREVLQGLRGNRIGFVFQDPMTALNPYLRVGDQLAEVLVVHQGASMAVARAEAVRMLEAVRIAAARERMDCYPHEFSGGMRQRVLLAMALLARPRLLIADEPTTALDVTVQAQLLRVLSEMQRELGMAVLLITHDLGIVEAVCERVLVMYAGRGIEQGATQNVLRYPRHPYTRALLRTRPSLHGRDRLMAIEGTPPRAGAPPTGCAFAPRCAEAFDRCRQERPGWVAAPNGGCACLRASIDYDGTHP